MASLLLSSRLRHSDSESEEEDGSFGGGRCIAKPYADNFNTNVNRLNNPPDRKQNGKPLANGEVDSDCEDGEIGGGDDECEAMDASSGPPAKKSKTNDVWKNSLLNQELTESITAFGVEKNLTEELYVEQLAQNKFQSIRHHHHDHSAPGSSGPPGTKAEQIAALDADLDGYKRGSDASYSGEPTDGNAQGTRPDTPPDTGTYDADSAECRFTAAKPPSTVHPATGPNCSNKPGGSNRKRKYGNNNVGYGTKSNCKFDSISSANAPIDVVTLDPLDSIINIADKIGQSIREPKKQMLESIVETLGVEHTIKIYNRTVDVEQNGGMLTMRGDRRRTPGGVFIQLCREDPGPDANLANLEAVITADRKRNRPVNQRQRAGRRKELTTDAFDKSKQKLDDFEMELERTKARMLELKKVRESSCSQKVKPAAGDPLAKNVVENGDPVGPDAEGIPVGVEFTATGTPESADNQLGTPLVPSGDSDLNVSEMLPSGTDLAPQNENTVRDAGGPTAVRPGDLDCGELGDEPDVSIMDLDGEL